MLHGFTSAGSASSVRSHGAERPKREISVLLVEFSRPVGFFTFIELEEYLYRCLDAPVDLVTPDALKPVIRDQVAAEVAYA